MKITCLLYFISIFTFSFCQGQNLDPWVEQRIVVHEQDSIEYLIITDNKKENSNKPILLFLQGSMPVPLILRFPEFDHLNLPFNYKSVVPDYNIVLISMPGIPLIGEAPYLNNEFCSIVDSTNPGSFPENFLKKNSLEHFVTRAELVIEDLKKNENLNYSEIHLIGHSQGAKVACVLASENETIASVSLLGFNHLGRIDESIRKERKKYVKGEIDFETYQLNCKHHYDSWESLVDKKDKTWLSFSINYSNFLAKITTSVFIGYGIEDVGAENSDLIPLILLKNGNSSYKLKPYENMDHNFFELKNGKPDYQNGAHWNDVIQDIVNWAESVK